MSVVALTMKGRIRVMSEKKRDRTIPAVALLCMSVLLLGSATAQTGARTLAEQLVATRTTAGGWTGSGRTSAAGADRAANHPDGDDHRPGAGFAGAAVEDRESGAEADLPL